ncbi:MAG: ABC transporter substrate-binding protein [Thermomicrobiales bacterium]|nr:ABC transporter substrate-binding protein [Thermomicrobiales bacterium]
MAETRSQQIRPELRFDRRSLMKGAAAAGIAAPGLGGLSTRVMAQATPGTEGGTPVAGGTLKLTLDAATSVDLNPIGIRTLDSFYLSSCIYDGLIRSSASWDEVEPALAESWDISDDGLTYTFHLRQGVTWHDGEPFTSADVLFTYGLILNKAIGSYMASDLTIIEGAQEYLDGTADTIAGLTAPDDNTVVFRLTETSGPFAFSILTQHSMIPEHVWKDVSAEEMIKPVTWDSGHIGTGSFQFTEYAPDQYLQLDRYDGSWRGAPLLDQVLFVHVGTTPEARGAALESGDLDYASFASTDFERMSGIETLNVGSKPVYNTRHLYVNLQQSFLQDERVLQAIAHAIDRPAICEQILTHMSSPLDGIAPEGFWTNPDVPKYPYDTAKAKELLAEAGWDPNQELQMSFYYADQAHADAFSIIQQQLIDAGIKATVFQVDPATIADFFYADNAPFHIMLGGLGMAPDMDGFSGHFMSDATWPNGQNASHYSNPEVDQLFIDGRRETDRDARKVIYDKLQVITSTELPAIPFYNLHLVAGFNKRVQNGDAIFNVWNRPYNWHIEEVWLSDGK